MPEGQADTLANENLLLIAEHLATKDDMKALRADFELFRKEVRTELSSMRVELGALENRLLVKLGGLMAAMLTLFRLL